MISCRVARRYVIEVLRDSTSEAVRLELESHLDQCEDCAEERARFALLGRLRRSASPPLSGAVERRILERLVTTARRAGPPPKTRRPLVRWWYAAPAIAVIALLVALATRPGPERSLADGETVVARDEGAVTFGGAHVRYRPRTTMRVHPTTRTLELQAGEVDVDVTPGLPGRFRVTTKRFVVEVLGTRFTVTSSGVRTLRGKVQVFDPAGRTLALLSAGQAWNLPPAPAAAPASAAVPTPAAVADAAPASAAVPAPTAVPAPAAVAIPDPLKHVAVSALLADAKAALAEGKVTRTRGLVRRALASHPSDHESVAAELLLAHALLVDNQPEVAITAYRRVIRLRPASSEAEVASFSVAQLLFERGRRAEADAALSEYLARYPLGRFVREARERQAEIKAAR